MAPRHVLLLALAACGGKAVPVVTLGSGNQAAGGGGDYVVYRFSGKLLAEPVTIREEIVSRDSGRVTIDVRAARGREERHWIQVGPDSPDARFGNVADEIYAVRDGAKERLPNPDNATLARLYDWVLVTADAEAKSHETAACDEIIAKEKTACECERSTHTRWGKTIRAEASRCRAFAWQRGPAKWSTDDGEILWQVEVPEANARR